MVLADGVLIYMKSQLSEPSDPASRVFDSAEPLTPIVSLLYLSRLESDEETRKGHIEAKLCSQSTSAGLSGRAMRARAFA